MLDLDFSAECKNYLYRQNGTAFILIILRSLLPLLPAICLKCYFLAANKNFLLNIRMLKIAIFFLLKTNGHEKVKNIFLSKATVYKRYNQINYCPKKTKDNCITIFNYSKIKTF